MENENKSKYTMEVKLTKLSKQNENNNDNIEC